MQGMGLGDEKCPFTFNFDAVTFKVGDVVSFRVSNMEDFPFAGELIEVHEDYVIIAGDPTDPSVRYKGTRESRPMVDGSQI